LADNEPVEGAFAIVLFVVVGVAAVAAIWALATSGRSYDQIGRGGMSIGDDRPPPATASRGMAAGSAAEREAEIRQMLEARNARRAARGEAPEDVDAQLRELTASPAAADPELREEVRALVEARNARRVARGEEPLDVEAEVERRLRELG
jgi:Spy/CpxP family protein refolding chaperone